MTRTEIEYQIRTFVYQTGCQAYIQSVFINGEPVQQPYYIAMAARREPDRLYELLCECCIPEMQPIDETVVPLRGHR